jgi:hypothetical protein
MELDRLQCPHCDGQRFSWIQQRVQFGDAFETVDGNLIVESKKPGPGTGDDINENGLYCTQCDTSVPKPDLVTANQNQ